jgi:prepilin-type N-terminal cleavage/methylation domain-containing protein
MSVIIKNNKKGFSLVELMVSIVLTGVLAVVATSLFYKFISYSNVSILQNNLDSDLRTLIQRLEAEIIPGRKVLATYNPPSDYGSTSITTTTSRLILELPANGAPVSSTNKDIAIIEFNPDPTSSLSNSTGNIGKLLFSYIPAVDSKRKKIIKASLNSYINDKD